MAESRKSIFQRYYTNEPFVDRYLNEPEAAVDVIIPVIHSNELWDANLRSLYREIPINRLLLADGGCTDDTIETASKYPRVVVLDHRNFASLGYSERKLIEAVETEWFIHTHSDVFLPDGWFDIMRKYQGEYDWYGCIERGTIQVEYDRDFGERPWAGAQFGRKSVFELGLKQVEDDYIYRQSDFLYRLMLEGGGFKEGYIRETYHYHQTMHRPSPWFRKITSVDVKIEMTPEEEKRTWLMELRGTIKYLEPTIPWAVSEVYHSMLHLIELKQLNWKDLQRWVEDTNPVWLPYVTRGYIIKKLMISFLKRIYRAFTRLENNEK